MGIAALNQTAMPRIDAISCLQPPNTDASVERGRASHARIKGARQRPKGAAHAGRDRVGNLEEGLATQLPATYAGFLNGAGVQYRCAYHGRGPFIEFNFSSRPVPRG